MALNDPVICRRQDFIIQGATGQAKSRCCITIANFSLGQWSGSHSFVISGAVTKHDMILGRDFFKQHGVQVDHAADTLEIDGNKVMVNSVRASNVDLISEDECDSDSFSGDNPCSIKQQLSVLKDQMSALLAHQASSRPMVNANMAIEAHNESVHLD